MSKCLMTLIVSETGQLDRGINPAFVLMLQKSDKYYWLKKEFKDSERLGENDDNNAEHYPDSDELTYVITDALIRFCPEISSAYDKIMELLGKIENSTNLSTPDFFIKYRDMKNHKESRRLLSLLREIFEDSRIDSKLAIHALVDCPMEPVIENLKRMNSSFELGITAKYRIKGKSGVEELL